MRRKKLWGRQRQHLITWTRELAHAVFELHPELREDNTLPRYFVAKEARRRGLRGQKVTEFVDREFAEGTWWKLVPDGVLKGDPHVKPWQRATFVTEAGECHTHKMN